MFQSYWISYEYQADYKVIVYPPPLPFLVWELAIISHPSWYIVHNPLLTLASTLNPLLFVISSPSLLGYISSPSLICMLYLQGLIVSYL